MKETQKRIVKNLENWYLIDSILFNNHAKKVISNGKDFREYVSIKNALLSNLFEFWSHIGYSPKDEKISGNLKELQEAAISGAKKGKALSSNIMKKADIISKIKEKVIKESKERPKTNVKRLADKIIREKFLQISLDNCLIGLPLLESKNLNSLATAEESKFKSDILSEAYKMMRDSLIHMSRSIALVDNSCCS